jgi:hypothetical protein
MASTSTQAPPARSEIHELGLLGSSSTTASLPPADGMTQPNTQSYASVAQSRIAYHEDLIRRHKFLGDSGTILIERLYLLNLVDARLDLFTAYVRIERDTDVEEETSSLPSSLKKYGPFSLPRLAFVGP